MIRMNKLTALAAAVALSGGLAACGGGGGTSMMTPEPTPQETCEDNGGRWNADMTCTTAAELEAERAVASARTAAAAAATAAASAADAAEAAANAQMANMGADEASYALARNAAMRARAASNAANAASAAAAATDDPDEAQRQQSVAEAQQTTAESERDNAVMYANMVADAQQAIEDENQRVMDVANARSAAMQSYMDADADATKAEAQADAAEAAAPGSPGAMTAREAATAARNAANAAKMAHDAITNGMTKAEADAQASEAATQAGHANAGYMTAKAENDTIQTNVATNEEQQRQRDVAAATTAASDAATDARAAATAARMSATNARNAANAANAAYMRAMAARTDSAEAKMQADAAAAAATMAENAAMAAEMAADAAEAARDGIDSAGSGEAAKAAQMTAETEQGKAETARDTASTQYMTAMTASSEAATDAGTHVLGLLMAANAVDVEDLATTPMVDEQAQAVMAVATAIGNAAGAGTGDADNNSSTASGGSDSTATAAWPANTPADPDATPPTEEVVMPLTITVTRTSGTDLVFRTEAAEEDDATTTEVDETIVTATKIGGLGVFMQGYSITDRGTHAIVFTDKDQDAAPVATARDLVTARELVNAVTDTTNTVTDLGTKSGNSYTGVTFYLGTPDATTDERTAFMGTLTCPANTACTVETTVVADGPDTHAVTGYVFTGSREAAPAITAMDAAAQAAANDYLVFGVWFDGDDSAGNDGTGAPQIAAFANGGRTFATPVALYGTATYSGSATGVYTAGESVDYFQGRASLTANFGDTPDEGVTDDAAGTVTGMIDQIVAGGSAMSDVISLNSDATPADGNITATGGFAGNARMGAPMVDGDVVTYTYTGTWGGQFYGAPAETDAVNTTAPGSAAGTFGVTGTDNMGTMDDTDDDVTRSYVGAFGAHKVE